jgi:heavy-metal-associated domain-containing protein
MIDSARARVAHALPGRLRLRFDRGGAAAEALEPLLAQLREQRGVRAARFNAASQSIVVEYDPAAVTEAVLLRRLPVAERAGPPSRAAQAPSSAAAEAVIRRWWEADRSLARATANRVDLRTLVPLALALLAVRQLLLAGELEAAPWHALLWYSYNIFYQFHPETRQPPG